MPEALSRRQLLKGIAVAGMVMAPRISRAREKITGSEGASEFFEVSHTELFVRGLDPAHDGLVLAQLSDIHVGLGTPDGRIISAVNAVNEARPDLVFLTGDFVTHSRTPIDHIPLVLQGLQAPAYSVLGNHDHYVDAPAVRESVEHMGYTVLQNQFTQVRLKGAPLTIFGIDDGGTRHDDVARTFHNAPTTGSRLVMAHTPPTFDKLPPQAGLTCFSGHTHGGQINLGSVTRSIFRRAGQPYLRGYYQARGNQLYVNRGLGFGKGGGMPRVNSDPEVSVFTLRVAST
jgi:predicted MPP superfamily phosphohydrolase